MPRRPMRTKARLPKPVPHVTRGPSAAQPLDLRLGCREGRAGSIRSRARLARPLPRTLLLEPRRLRSPLGLLRLGLGLARLAFQPSRLRPQLLRALSRLLARVRPRARDRLDRCERAEADGLHLRFEPSARQERSRRLVD